MRVKSCPLRALRVGSTQSNRSMPRATDSTRSSGMPTPIRYRGRSAGSSAAVISATSYMTGVGSPTLSPPIA